MAAHHLRDFLASVAIFSLLGGTIGYVVARLLTGSTTDAQLRKERLVNGAVVGVLAGVVLAVLILVA